MNIKKLWCLLFAITVLASCEKEEEEEVSVSIFKEEISGYVQKGPFINGTSILISELDKNLVATGRNFTTQISDNSGSFAIQDVELKSQYVSIKADGFYFNEVNGIASTAPITLYALTDLKDKNKVNVNVLSYLEKSRTEYLIGTGLEFAAAKQQAQKEVLAIFEIEKAEMGNSESLDISQGGDDNAILLAASVILQGNRSEGQLSELMANMITDMKEDGTVDNPAYGSALLNGIKNLSLEMVRKNVEERYKSLGITTAIGDFEKYVEGFKNNTDFVHVSEFVYPELAGHLNILWVEDGSMLDTKGPESHYSLAASVPDNSSIRVVMKKIEGDWTIHSSLEHWEIHGSSAEGMSEIKSLKSGQLLEATVEFSQKGSCLVEIYEGDASEPTITKTIHWEPNLILDYPEEGQYGKNLLSATYSGQFSTGELIDITPGEYSLAVNFPEDEERQVVIRMNVDNEQFININPAKIHNWQYERTEYELIITATGRGTSADMFISLGGRRGHSSISNETEGMHYSIHWVHEGWQNGELNDHTFVFDYHEQGNFGINLLNLPDKPISNQIAPGEYSLALNLPDDKEYWVQITLIPQDGMNISIDPMKVQNWNYKINHNNELTITYIGKGKALDMSIRIEGNSYLNVYGPGGMQKEISLD